MNAKTTTSILKGWVIAAIAVCATLLVAASMAPAAAYAAPYGGYQTEVQLTEKDSDGDWVSSYQKNADGTYVYDANGDRIPIKANATEGAGYVQLVAIDQRGIAKNKRVITIYAKNTNPNYSDERWNEYTTKNNGDLYDDTDVRAIQKKIKGIKYNAKKNTLTLKNAKYAKYRLFAYGMGSNFKISLSGSKNQLASIEAYAAETYTWQTVTRAEGWTDDYTSITGGVPTSLTITGKGKLTINKNKMRYNAITIDGRISGEVTTYDAANDKFIYQDYSKGTKAGLKVTKNAKLVLFAYGTSNAVGVSGTTISKAKKAISIKGTYKTKALKKSQKNTPVKNSTAYSKEEKLAYLGTDGQWYEDGKMPEGVNVNWDADTYSMWLYSFNGGTAWGKVTKDSPTYIDKITRAEFYSTWEMYSLDAAGKFTLIGTVGNDQNLPKGYSLDLEEGYVAPVNGSTYTYVIADAKIQ